MAGEDRPGQVIEEFLTGLTPVALPLGLGRIVTLLGDLRGVTMGTGDALGPAQVADRLETLHVVDEVLDVDHRPWPRNPVTAFIQRVPARCPRRRIVPPEKPFRHNRLESRLSLPRHSAPFLLRRVVSPFTARN